MELYDVMINRAISIAEGNIARRFFESLGMDKKTSKLIEIMIRNDIPLEAFVKSLKEYNDWLQENGDDD